jgi:hypothetical protein
MKWAVYAPNIFQIGSMKLCNIILSGLSRRLLPIQRIGDADIYI